MSLVTHTLDGEGMIPDEEQSGASRGSVQSLHRSLQCRPRSAAPSVLACLPAGMHRDFDVVKGHCAACHVA